MSCDDLKSARNMMWAGYMFMNTTWIQNQIAKSRLNRSLIRITVDHDFARIDH